LDYAIIRLGNKQHKVRDGETLVVDRVSADEGKSFEPDVLLGDATVTATVVAHERGPKIRIGKYRRRTGYKRHNGFRAATSRVQISLGGAPKRRAAAAKPAAARPEAATPETGAPVVEAVAEAPKAKPAAKPKPTVPEGYDELTIAGLKTAIEGWSIAEVEAALAYEQANAARKGAIAALESALAKESD
jgi:large subunit ribosomal protein L21